MKKLILLLLITGTVFGSNQYKYKPGYGQWLEIYPGYSRMNLIVMIHELKEENKKLRKSSKKWKKCYHRCKNKSFKKDNYHYKYYLYGR